MPLLAGSRYTFSSGIRDDAGRLLLTERDPYVFRDLPDTRVHLASQGDTLFDLAGRPHHRNDVCLTHAIIER